MSDAEHRPAALVVGAGSAIAQALIRRLHAGGHAVWAVSRAAPPASLPPVHWTRVASYLEDDIAACCAGALAGAPGFSRVVICNGLLHAADVAPEKRVEDFSARAFLTTLEANALVPMLWLQALLPVLPPRADCRIAVLSARVGSIGDNRLGGWYSYRASKAALNMLLKTLSIEYARRRPQTRLVAFHPGTTDTPLSRPFQASVPESRLFSPDFVAERLLAVLDACPPDRTLRYVDWDAQPIPW